MKTQINGQMLMFRFGLVCLLALTANCSWGKPLPPDKLAFVGLGKPQPDTDWISAPTAQSKSPKITLQDEPGWFTVSSATGMKAMCQWRVALIIRPPFGMLNFRMMTSC